jgi:heme exporter protein B
VSWWKVARLIAMKDLRIEWHTRVLLYQVVPFAAIVMLVFGFALGTDAVTERVAPGLVWLATLFSLLLLVQRSFVVETEDGALDTLRVAGVDPAGIFWGKTIALAVKLGVLEIVLLATAILLYRAELRPSGLVLLVGIWVTATLGLASVGTLYGGLAAGVSGRETLLPLLLVPVVAPVLIGATRAVEAALGTARTAVADGWPWLGLVATFAVALSVAGTLAFGALIEDEETT